MMHKRGVSPPGFHRERNENKTINSLLTFFIQELQTLCNSENQINRNRNLSSLYVSIFENLFSMKSDDIENINLLVSLLPSTFISYEDSILSEKYILLVKRCFMFSILPSNSTINEIIFSLLNIVYNHPNNGKLCVNALRTLFKLIVVLLKSNPESLPFERMFIDTLIPFILLDKALSTRSNRNNILTLHRLSLSIFSIIIDSLSSFYHDSIFKTVYSALLQYISDISLSSTKSLISIFSIMQTIISNSSVIKNQIIILLSSFQNFLLYDIHSCNNKSAYQSSEDISDISETDSESKSGLFKATNADYSYKVRLLVLKCLQCISISYSDEFYSNWASLLPASSSSETSYSINGASLVSVILYDTSSNVRNTATSILCSMLERSPFVKWKALTSSSPVPSLPSIITTSLLSLHNCLVYNIIHSHDHTVLLYLIQCLTVLFKSAPYHILSPSISLSIPSLLTNLVFKYKTSSSSSVNIAIISLISQILDTPQPLLELEQWFSISSNIISTPSSDSKSPSEFIAWLIDDSRSSFHSQSASPFQDGAFVLSLLALNYRSILCNNWIKLWKILSDSLSVGNSPTLKVLRIISNWLLAKPNSASHAFFTNPGSYSLLSSLISLLSSKDSHSVSDAVKTKAFNCLSLIPSYVFESVVVDHSSLVSIMLDGVYCSNTQIRASACDSIGAFLRYIYYLPSREIVLIKRLITPLLLYLADSSKLVRIRCSLSIAGLCCMDSFFIFDRSYIIEMENRLLLSINDDEKVACNVIRTIGCVFVSLLLNIRDEEKELISNVFSAFHSAFQHNKAYKLQWNICFALGLIFQAPFFQSQIRNTDHSITIIRVLIKSLFEVIFSSSVTNFKIKIASSTALLSVKSISFFENSLQFLFYFRSLVTLVSNFDLIGGNFIEYKYKTSLYSSLVSLLNNMFNLAENDETGSFSKAQYEEISQYRQSIQKPSIANSNEVISGKRRND